VGKSARVDFSKLHQQSASIAEQLCDAQNVGRNLSKISGPPHVIAEINAIETLLRSLGHQSGRVDAKDRVARP
jgi:hypothetical protein